MPLRTIHVKNNWFSLTNIAHKKLRTILKSAEKYEKVQGYCTFFQVENPFRKSTFSLAKKHEKVRKIQISQLRVFLMEAGLIANLTRGFNVQPLWCTISPP